MRVGISLSPESSSFSFAHGHGRANFAEPFFSVGNIRSEPDFTSPRREKCRENIAESPWQFGEKEWNGNGRISYCRTAHQIITNLAAPPQAEAIQEIVLLLLMSYYHQQLRVTLINKLDVDSQSLAKATL